MIRLNRALRVFPLSFVFIPLACDDSSVAGIDDAAGPEPGPDAGLFADVGLDATFPDGPPGKCAFYCSSDMHQVFDCEGHLVQTCPDDQGCNPDTGGCVAACESSAVNKGSVGCEFYATTRVLGCFAAYVANVWTKPITIGVEIKGEKVNIDGFARIPSGTGKALTYAPLPGGLLPPGQVAILFLTDLSLDWPQCPGGAVAAEVPSDGANPFHITTDYPAAVYDIDPYGGGDSAVTSATLLLPTSVWGDNYVAIDPWQDKGYVDPYTFLLKLIAREDATDVTILPSAELRNTLGTVVMPKGVPVTATLGKGEVLTLWSAGLAGSVIRATKPVGAWTGGDLSIDQGYCCQDQAHQQLPPVKTLGSEYVAVRYRDRYEGTEESPPWRILGIVDNTELVYEPSAPPDAPAEINAGEVATFYAPGPFVVRSKDADHPIYVSAHMSGCAFASPPDLWNDDCRGDPEFINVVPATQFLSSYVFLTDMTYPETDVVVVRARGNDGFKDVVLDCAGKLTGWQSVGSSYEYTRVALSRGNYEAQSYAGGTCDNGRHESKSDAPFGITVWGWGSAATGLTPFTQAVSYGYPGGQAVRPINAVKVPTVPK